MCFELVNYNFTRLHLQNLLNRSDFYLTVMFSKINYFIQGLSF